MSRDIYIEIVSEYEGPDTPVITLEDAEDDQDDQAEVEAADGARVPVVRVKPSQLTMVAYNDEGRAVWEHHGDHLHMIDENGRLGPARLNWSPG